MKMLDFNPRKSVLGHLSATPPRLRTNQLRGLISGRIFQNPQTIKWADVTSRYAASDKDTVNQPFRKVIGKSRGWDFCFNPKEGWFYLSRKTPLLTIKMPSLPHSGFVINYDGSKNWIKSTYADVRSYLGKNHILVPEENELFICVQAACEKMRKEKS